MKPNEKELSNQTNRANFQRNVAPYLNKALHNNDVIEIGEGMLRVVMVKGETYDQLTSKVVDKPESTNLDEIKKLLNDQTKQLMLHIGQTRIEEPQATETTPPELNGESVELVKCPVSALNPIQMAINLINAKRIDPKALINWLTEEKKKNIV